MMMTSNTTQGTSTVQTGTSFVATFSDNNPSVHEAVTTGVPTDRIMIFRTAGVNHTFTVPTGGLNCDILMIGGGGGGGEGYGNAGGAGACIVAINQTLPAGSCFVYVGAGNFGVNNGVDSIIQVATLDRYRAKGGGGAVSSYSANGISGGCGGSVSSASYSGGQAVITNVVNGAIENTLPRITSTYAVLGNAGYGGTSYGGGGGIGDAGISSRGGNGKYDVSINGTTYNFRSYFANGGNNFGVLHTDSNYYIGGGGLYGNPNPSVAGGGGSQDVDAIANTGGGGGGGGDRSVAGWGYGGSGIIIIRYRSSTATYTHTPTSTTTLSTTLGTPSIELVRGTQGDSNTDYKIGNYNGDFIVKSSVSNTDTDYLKISSTGAITNPTGTASWNTGSDRRIKENIARASYDMCYDNIDKLELNRFNYIKGFNTVNRDITQLGFIAQEVYDIFPKAISTNGYYSDTLIIPDLLSIDVTQINYTLYGAVKKLMEINKDKEMRLKRLEGLLNIEDGSGNLLDTSNIVIDTSNIVIDTSNIVIDTSSIAIDSSSNVVIDITPYDILSSNLNI